MGGQVRQAVDQQDFEADGGWASSATAMIWAERGPQDSIRHFSDRIARVTAATGRADAAPARLRARAAGFHETPYRAPVDADAATDATQAPAALAPSPAEAARRVADESDRFDEIYAALDYEAPPPADETRRRGRRAPLIGRAGARWSEAALRRAPLSDAVFLAGLAAVFVLGLIGALAPLFSGAADTAGGAAAPLAVDEIETDSIAALAPGATRPACEGRMVETATPLDGAPPPEMVMSRVGPLRPVPCDGSRRRRPAGAAAERGLRQGALATASLSPYLGAEALRGLIAARPEKCVLDPAIGPRACAEVTRYETDAPRFVRSSPLRGGALLEISGGYGVEGDALCHYAPGVTAMVVGGALDPAAARDFERQVETHFRTAPGEKICQRLRRAGAVKGREVYVADVFVDGARAPDRSDPRVFELRARL